MSIADLSAKLEAEGYTIREIEVERGAYEVEMIDRNGLRVEGYLHPLTGEVMRNRHGRDD